jgi:hypothetical protein
MGPQGDQDRAGTPRLPATVTVIGGAKVVIEYADGHTVYLSVEPDSFVLRWHLGLDGPAGEDS